MKMQTYRTIGDEFKAIEFDGTFEGAVKIAKTFGVDLRSTVTIEGSLRLFISNCEVKKGEKVIQYYRRDSEIILSTITQFKNGVNLIDEEEI